MRNAGLKVIGAVELDEDAAATYALNFPDAKLWNCDIRKINAANVRLDLGLKVGELTLLKACPPCQGFSTLSGDRVDVSDERNSLVLAISKFVKEMLPKFVMLENVPAFEKDGRFRRFASGLSRLGYVSRAYVVNAKDFGVPQSRRRLIWIATRLGLEGLPLTLPVAPIPTVTVRAAFRALEERDAKDDPLAIARATSEIVSRRISAIPAGGTRFDLPARLQLACHRRLAKSRSRSAAGPYGRIKWDGVSPTMTTRCTTVSCGSFIHPAENRGITLREAACLQTFPLTYQFLGSYGSVERQIGNAVPVRLVEEIVRQLVVAHRASASGLA